MAILPVNLQILHSYNGEPVAKRLRYSDEKTTFLSPEISLLVTGLRDTILTSLPPSIQSCSSKFWAWSCIASTLIRGGGGFTSTRSWTGHLSQNTVQCLKYYCNRLQLARTRILSTDAVSRIDPRDVPLSGPAGGLGSPGIHGNFLFRYTVLKYLVFLNLWYLGFRTQVLLHFLYIWMYADTNIEICSPVRQEFGKGGNGKCSWPTAVHRKIHTISECVISQ